MNKLKSGLSILFGAIFLFVAIGMHYDRGLYFAGAGNGENTEMQTIADVNAVVDSVLTMVDRLFDDAESTPVIPTVMQLNTYNATTSETLQHTSATVCIDYNVDCIATEAENCISITMDGTEDWYISYSTGELLVVGKGLISVQQPVVLEIYIDFELYCTKSGMFLVKYNDITSNAPLIQQFPQNAIGKWLNASAVPFFEGQAQELVSMNYSWLSIAGEYLNEHLSDGFEQNGDTYTMKQECFDAFASQVLSERMNIANTAVPDFPHSGSFKINLKDREAPIIILKDDTKLKDGSTDVQVSQHQTVTIKNVDNTVINLLDTIVVYEIKDLIYQGIYQGETP